MSIRFDAPRPTARPSRNHETTLNSIPHHNHTGHVPGALHLYVTGCTRDSTKLRAPSSSVSSSDLCFRKALTNVSTYETCGRCRNSIRKEHATIRMSGNKNVRSFPIAPYDQQLSSQRSASVCWQVNDWPIARTPQTVVVFASPCHNQCAKCYAVHCQRGVAEV